MKNNLVTIVLVLLALTACKEKPTETMAGNLMLTGIKSAKGSEIVSINLDSGYVNITPLNCYLLGSTVYDPNTGGYGYVSCDTVFTMINPENGDVIKSIRLQGLLSPAVIDPGSNLLVGLYREYTYIDDPDSSNNATIPVLHNYLLTTSLETGDVVLKKEITLDGVFLCTNYFDPVSNLYVMERSDSRLIFINPFTGDIAKTVSIGIPLTNVIYNPDDRTIISMRADGETGKYYIEIYNPETGENLSSKEVAGIVGYHYCMAAWDTETECYLAVSSDDEVLFIDPPTGEIKKKYKLDYHLSDIRFLRK